MDRKRKAMDNDDGAVDKTDEEEQNSSEDLFADDDASTAVNPVDSPKDEEMRSYAGVTAASLASFTRFSLPPLSPRATIFVRWPKESGTLAFEPHPHANSAEDSWDDQHVRMPFSKESVFPVSESSGRKTLKYR